METKKPTFVDLDAGRLPGDADGVAAALKIFNDHIVEEKVIGTVTTADALITDAARAAWRTMDYEDAVAESAFIRGIEIGYRFGIYATLSVQEAVVSGDVTFKRSLDTDATL